MQQGWIKLHRKVVESPVFDNPNLLKLWIWCLCKATHTDHEVIIGKQIVGLHPGQFVFGRLKAATELKMNDRTVYDYMKMLQKLEMLQLNPNNKFTLVTIINWGFYQEEVSNIQHQNTQQYTMEGTQQNNTNKNVKNGKNERKIFIPPSADEVNEYCRERNNVVDAEKFVAFYEAKGWMIGKNKMKDWKAAVRTWEKGQKGDFEHAGKKEQRADYEKISL